MGRVVMNNGDLNTNCQWGSIEIHDVVGGNVNAHTNYGELNVILNPTSFQGSFNLQSQSGMINVDNFEGYLTTDSMQKKSGSWGNNSTTTFSVSLSSDSGKIGLAFDKEIDFEAKHKSWRKNWNVQKF
eukprot:TRINITY_DN3838_c0_g1_i1.p1 TRINITY_DN3838_c0_g1~~TRINITY_DN3838_c0_g1_i1.p1  ORF type:complete len:128 (-),score=24.45 TRINITY_DN3838_c0_g1_i1:61-444(-)